MQDRCDQIKQLQLFVVAAGGHDSRTVMASIEFIENLSIYCIHINLPLNDKYLQRLFPSVSYGKQ